MCGIAGGFSNQKLDKQALQQATDRLSHRGPDAYGYYLNDSDTIFLGHRRLSILDLSETANQPMYSADGRYVMVYNGELYNYESLRNKLPNFSWKTTGDSEVILELFASFGTKSFTWFNGMFAIAIYDIHENKLYLCRDQIGIKPLFYYWDGKTFIFGSELKVVVTHSKLTGVEKLEINKEAIPYFLHLGFIPEPHTIYRQVYKFPSANYAVLDCASNNLDFFRYWSAEQHFLSEPLISEQKTLATYKHLLFDVIESQMISDVPLGTFLSGGIDSSLVTAVASKISKQKVKSFSIGFNEAKYDESAYAEDIATNLGTEHHTFKVSVDDILELIPSLLEVYDEPYADSSAFPTMLVSRLARQHVTVTLSGDGGDELFQGYGMYAWANRLSKPLNKIMRKPIYHITQMGNNRYKRAAELFDYPSPKRLHTHIFSQEQYFFSEKELNNLLINNAFNFESINRLDIPENSANPAEKQAFWDIKYYLKDDLLVKVDRASMQYSLECRVPLLDTRIVELGLNIDYRLKVREGYGTKYLMKKVLYDLVPRKLFERPKKGFAIPLKEWLQGPLKYLINDYLDEETIRQYGVVSPEYVKDLLQQFQGGKDYLYNRIWLLVVLHWWLKAYRA
ncbi:MAG: asparagine synthase (glutamine-hydrolyzing) [Flavipsychrobacter sp.]|nr:asparagine synthase (glutamine-hydrolyzing) [Flavipsychrobacter sp.]